MSRANSLEPALAPHVRLRNRYRAPQCLAQLIADQPLSAPWINRCHRSRINRCQLQSRSQITRLVGFSLAGLPSLLKDRESIGRAEDRHQNQTSP